MPIEQISISKIRLDGGTQSRHSMNQDRINQMARQINWDKKEYPAIELYSDGPIYWPADGFHRINAAIKAKQETIKANVQIGTLRDALKACLTANCENDTNGMHRSKADRIAVITKMLTDPEWSKWSQNQIAKWCRVDVEEVRDCEHLRVSPQDSKRRKTSIRKVSRGGKVYLMRTKRIGKKLQSADQKQDAKKVKAALRAIQKAEEVCTCTCPACKKCKRKKKKA